jgi:hypothetical protein
VRRRVRKMGREERNTRKRRRSLEEMVNTCEMNMGNQYTHKIFKVACGFHVEGMLQRGRRGQR